MSILQSIILGIIQGLTEFLPVSSTAHLLLTQYYLGWKFPQQQAFSFDVLVQMGTLLALIVFFWRDLWEILKAVVQGLLRREPFKDPHARLGWLLVLGTIPAGLAGLFLKDAVENLFQNPAIAAVIRLFITALLLIIAEQVGRRTRQLESLTWIDALWVGVFQVLSVFPGASRSGSTITGGMTRYLDRPAAARFAFLLSVPIMAAAGLFSLKDLAEMPGVSSFLPILLPGVLAAAVVGYLAVKWLIGFVARRPLYIFAAYCVGLGMFTLVFSLIRG